jgi:hypothetical protein
MVFYMTRITIETNNNKNMTAFIFYQSVFGNLNTTIVE